ncbi:MAG: hypothetical protein V2A69_12860 [Pseudomonadota bacterium]
MNSTRQKKLREHANQLRVLFPECKIEAAEIAKHFPASWEMADEVYAKIVIWDFFSAGDHITAKVDIAPSQPKGFDINFTVWVQPLYPKDVEALFHTTPPLEIRGNPLARSGVIKKLYDFLLSSLPTLGFETKGVYLPCIMEIDKRTTKKLIFRDFLEIDMRTNDTFDKFTLRIEFSFHTQGFDEALKLLAAFQEKWKRVKKSKKTFVDEKYNTAITSQGLRTIFVQCENESLEKALKDCAREIDCTVRYGEPSSPDIIAFSYIVAVVDRTILGKDAWDTYLDYFNETKDDTPIFIIDSNNEVFSRPDSDVLKRGKWFFFDMHEPRSIGEIVSMIKKMRLRLKEKAIKNPQEHGVIFSDFEPWD